MGAVVDEIFRMGRRRCVPIDQPGVFGIPIDIADQHRVDLAFPDDGSMHVYEQHEPGASKRVHHAIKHQCREAAVVPELDDDDIVGETLRAHGPNFCFELPPLAADATIDRDLGSDSIQLALCTLDH